MHVLIPEAIAIDECLQRSPGTRKADAALIERDHYDVDALLPKDEWAVVENSPDQNKTVGPLFVALIDLREAVQSVLGASLEGAGNIEAARALAARVDVRDVLSECQRSMASLFTWSPSRFKTIGLMTNATGHNTVTVDNSRGKRLGIHLDSWDSTDALRGRELARNRICVNLGAATRYFLFSAVTAGLIDSALTSAERPTAQTLGREVTATDFARVFLSKNSDVPIYRLKVPPGYAYIAPTEALPHDGSAPDPERYDFSAHAMADFTPTAGCLAAAQVVKLP